MKEFLRIFKKVKGFDVIKQYMKAHIFGYACIAVLVNGLSKKSLEIVRLMVDNKILKRLRNKYAKYISNYNPPKIENVIYDRCVWICWWQGLDEAPEIVRKCISSVVENAGIEKVVVVTSENYKNYIEMPQYIIEKFNKGRIGFAHFSDLLRLELLIKYGGVWIDATVFMSGFGLPEYILDVDLFVYQILKPGLDGHSDSISNWLIAATPNQRLLCLTRDLLYEYWKDYNVAIDYYIFHKFFQLAIEKYPNDYKNIPKVSSETPHILLLCLFEKYDSKKYEIICKQTNIHKLSYKFEQAQMTARDTYYSFLFHNHD